MSVMFSQLRTAWSPLRLLVTLARRFVRRRDTGSAFFVLTVGVAILMTSFMGQQALSLTLAQGQEQQLGVYQHSFSLSGGLEPGDGDTLTELETLLESRNVTSSQITIFTPEIKTDDDDRTRVFYTEADWGSGAFDGRYSLLEGTWPTQPGEIAVTNASDVNLTLGDSLDLLSGRFPLQVVGIADDRYAKSAGLLAAEQTWGSMDSTIVEDFALSGQMSVYWSGSEEDHANVLDAINEMNRAKQLPPIPENEFNGLLVSVDKPTSLVRPSWVALNPAAFSLPVLLIPSMSIVFAFGVLKKRFDRSIQLMSSLGVPHRPSVSSVLLALLPWVFGAATVGIGLGVLLGLLTRSVLRSFYWQPLAPVHGLAAPIAQIMAVVAPSTCIASFRFYRAAAKNVQTTSPRRLKRFAVFAGPYASIGRRLLVVIGLGVVFWQAATLSTGIETMQLASTLTVLTALATPDILGLLLKRLPQRKAHSRLAVRMLQSRFAMSAASVITLVMFLGIPLGVLVTTQSAIAADNEGLYPPVATNQLAVHGIGGSFQPASTKVETLARDLLQDRTRHMKLRYLGSEDTSVGADSDGLGFVAAVDSADDASILFNRSLTESEKSTLTNGGVLSLDDWTAETRSFYTSTTGDTTNTPSEPLTSQPAQIDNTGFV